ncbi:MAG: S8 family serine peptidase [Planctomycetota bacterium]
MQRTPTLVLTSLLACAGTLPAHAQVDEIDRIEIPGQLVVCFESEALPDDLESIVASFELASIEPRLRLQEIRPLLQWQRRGEEVFTNVVLLDFTPASLDLDVLRAGLRNVPSMRWTSPNVGLTGDVQELVPNDPQYPAQYHHPLMQNDDAWNITLGDSSIVMGITDDGVLRSHEDLQQNIWVNVAEVPGDGIDNDGNGYIDDVNGWDFVFNNNNPDPNGGNDHGTHCAGIAGARTNNAIGVAGTAGESTIMPIQFYASGQPWTAANIAESFAYGADNGARILSTSYNINGWVGDPVVTAAFDYIYDQGVLHFNSAGNGSELNPARQAFHQTFLVVSTDSSDTKSGFSNFGTGVDVSAPGSSVLSTILGNGYGTKSGTSMAAPNAAGVAALIWSANPSWTRDQVAAQLVATADDIDAQNPGLEGLLGGGRVNSFRAVTETLPPPTLVLAEGLPSDGGALVGDLTSFRLRFDQILDPATVNSAGAFSLVGAGADDTFGTADDLTVPITWDEYLIAGNEVSFAVTAALPSAGRYALVANASVLENPFGTALDGNGDGVPGDSWSTTFSACSVVVLVEDNAESGAGWSVVDTNLSTGSWTVPPEVPIGGGLRGDPASDYDGSGRCFLTENAPGNTDVDGGPTRLISRIFDLSVAPDPYISFAAWMTTSGNDVLEVDISNDDGATWTSLDVIQNTTEWEVLSYRVTDFVQPTAQSRLRFSIADVGNPSVTEAAVDFLRVFVVDCGPGPIGTSYCVGETNSTGSGSSIRAEGSAVVADNDFTLVADSVPAGAAGVFFFGTQQAQVPAANGFRCVDGLIRRLGVVVQPDAMGESALTLDLSMPPTSSWVVAGASLNFQFWYRDAVGAGSNFSDGVAVDFQ